MLADPDIIVLPTAAFTCNIIEVAFREQGILSGNEQLDVAAVFRGKATVGTGDCRQLRVAALRLVAVFFSTSHYQEQHQHAAQPLLNMFIPALHFLTSYFLHLTSDILLLTSYIIHRITSYTPSGFHYWLSSPSHRRCSVSVRRCPGSIRRQSMCGCV